jgi:hypothetical protein
MESPAVECAAILLEIKDSVKEVGKATILREAALSDRGDCGAELVVRAQAAGAEYARVRVYVRAQIIYLLSLTGSSEDQLRSGPGERFLESFSENEPASSRP